jgi:replication factor C subunit 2/4
MLRYSRLSNAQVLAKLLDVCDKENVNYTEDGLEAIVFTAQGDMRQALNNLQVKFNEICKFANSFSTMLNKQYF